MKIIFKIVFVLFLNTGFFSLDAQIIQQQLAAMPNISFKQIHNAHFKEYYEIFIDQPIDHENPLSQKFRQRLFLGFNSAALPSIINTDGYAIDYAAKSDYENELVIFLNANLITVEHRYFGKSVPDSINYKYLTVKQAAEDAHHIKTIFSAIFKNKWISTGISKGGQAALAYKMLYPEDVNATVVYGTAIKSALNENKMDSMLTYFQKTPCGNELEKLRLYAFENKVVFIPLLRNYIILNHLFLKQFDLETYFDYMLLELPFSFRQNGNNCDEIPPITAGLESIFNYLTSVIPPRFYDAKNSERLKPAFYMSYHELGYYEYDIEKYKPYLKQMNYSNKKFAPEEITINFDKTYLDTLNKFLKTKEAEKIIFIFGENDPWSAMQNQGRARKEIIRNGSHKSRIADLNVEQKESLIKYLSTLLAK